MGQPFDWPYAVFDSPLGGEFSVRHSLGCVSGSYWLGGLARRPALERFVCPTLNNQWLPKWHRNAPERAVLTAKEIPVILRMPKARVLVVDDDKRLADSLALVLAHHGFSVSAAYSGSEAVESALKFRPDFIVMDVMMIGIDGVDAAIAICETLPHCHILLMSGAEDAVKRLDKGSRRGHSFELMMKPVLTASLLDKLQSLPPVYRD